MNVFPWETYPPVSFYFSVAFAGVPPLIDNAFNEVSGIKADTDTDTIKEGGENRFSYRVPTRSKYDNLVLKRGLILTPSPIQTWCFEMLSGSLETRIEPKDIVVFLLAPYHVPLMMWTFHNAWPVKWELSNLNAQENKIAVETLEFAYTYFTAQNTGAGAALSFFS